MKVYVTGGSLSFKNTAQPLPDFTFSYEIEVSPTEGGYVATDGDEVLAKTLKLNMSNNGKLQSIEITISGVMAEVFSAYNGTYAAPPKLMMSPLRAPTPVAADGQPEETQEAETSPELSEIAETVEAEGTETVEGTEQPEGYETVEGTEQTEGTESVEEIVESAPTPVLRGILDNVDLDTAPWLGDEDGKECYISGDNLVFANSSGTYEIGLDAPLTQNGGDWKLENGSVTITFVMKDDMLDQIVYVGGNSFDAVYSAPAEEEDTEEDEPKKEEPVEKAIEETVEEVTEKTEEQTEPVEPEEVPEQTAPAEETESTVEE